MSADANSAFGDALSGKRSRRLRHDDRGDSPGSLSQDYQPVEDSTAPSQSHDTSKRGRILATSTTNAQVAPLTTGTDWFDQSTLAPSPLEIWLQSVQQQLSRTFADQVTPVRLASHISVLLVATIILVLSNVDIPDLNFSFRLFPNSALLGTSSSDLSSQLNSLLARSNGAFPGNESLQRAAVPFTTVHVEPTPEVAEIQLYTVQPGDTVLGIAEKFGLKPESVQWANPGLEANADLIRPGDSLAILPINGALHTITSGDSLMSIANQYKVTVEDIVGYAGNNLTDANTKLTVAAKLVIPNGVKPFINQQAVAYSGGAVPATAKIGGGNFIWPASGSINQRYWGGHGGIDLGAWTGAPVKAADGGYVALATGGWNAGYGNHVIIDHGNGFVTLYAHLNSIFVKQGESVAAGQQIGSVGNTGNSTGPHLHFEIRYQGVPRNPLNYLP
ncbi:MAG: peptidoglycan DD-metalloendopeptidase family protein [Caldilineaceae bacterium]|nr:peptidoglycan DD-metalloendopeptidase family protein [Caldilineaceae bacterium]